MSGSRGRICLFVPYLYPVMGGKQIPLAGGAEVQQAEMARGLVREGFEVSVVTCDFGQPAREVVEGITLLRAYSPTAGIPGVRFFHPRLTLAVRELWNAGADVYFVQTAGIQAGLAHDVARLRRARFVFMAAHDFDVLRSLPGLPTWRERWWYRRALRDADAVLAQTEFQRERLLEHFRVSSRVIANPVPLPADTVDAGQEGVIVWLATYKPGKRPEWFIDLARALPMHRFVMCGSVPPPPATAAAFEAAQAAGREVANLEVRGFLPRARLSELFREASLFVHTSPAEGFPNTVLEAWAHGVPSVSSVDPDQVVTRERLGEVATTPEALEHAVARLMGDPGERRAAGARARAYVRTHHDPGMIADQLAGVLDRVITLRR